MFQHLMIISVCPNWVKWDTCDRNICSDKCKDRIGSI